MESLSYSQLPMEQLVALLNALPIPTFIWQEMDDDFVLRNCNVAAVAFTKQTIAELVGTRASAMYQESKQVLHDLRHCLQHKSAVENEIEYRFKLSDENKYLRVNYAYLPTDIVMVHIVDITERKKLEMELQITLDATTDGIWSWRFDTDQLYFSPNWYGMLGFDPNAFPPSYNAWSELLHPDDRERALGRAEEYLRTKPDRYENEFRLRKSDGSYCYIRSAGRVVEWDATGQAVRMIGSHEDITDRKNAEEKILFQANLIDAVDQAIIVTKPDGQIIYWNPFAEKLYGWSADEVVGESVVDVTVPRVSRAQGREIMERLGAGESWSGEFDVRRRDGVVFPCLVTDTPVYDSKGDLVAVIGISIDMTESNRLKNELLESQKRYEKAQRVGHVGSWEYDPATTRFWFSDEAKRMFGFEVDADDFATEHVERCILERQRVQQALVDLIERDEEYDLVFDISTHDNGARKTIHSVAEIERDSQKQAVKVSGVITDITERRKMEAHLRQAQKLESIGTLASGVAHEINNPLMGMLNYAELMKDRIEDEKLLEYLDEIGAEGKRIATIVSDLLSFSSQRPEEHSRASVKEIVERSLSLVGSHIRRSQIALQLDIPEDLPRVRCRSQQIQQVVINLVANATDALNAKYAEYDPNKLLTIHARAIHHNVGMKVRVTVEDRGIGIPESARERIFDPFFSTKERYQGTGLGLSISYGIIQEHGGQLVVESVQDEFTRFSFDLPAA